MKINWYPGHMVKAQRELKKLLPRVEMLIEIVDARLPAASANPVVAELAAHKPRLRLLNKADLADPDTTERWLRWLQDQGLGAQAITAQDPSVVRGIVEQCKAMTPGRHHSVVHAVVIGIPNVGKSTLINTLAGRKAAKVGNKPAVTRAQQMIHVPGGLTLFDSPGFLWKHLADQEGAHRLAASGAIGEGALDPEQVALWTLDFMARHYPDRLRTIYGLTELGQPTDLLEAVGVRRGCVRKGGIVDLARASDLVLHDLRKGALGRVSLEAPPANTPA